MSLPIKIFLYATGVSFALIGMACMFRTENAAEELGLALVAVEGASNVRSLIGGHYLAMSAVTIFAVYRHLPILLLPIGALEGLSFIGRCVAGLNGEMSAQLAVMTVMELGLAVALLLIAKQALPGKS